MEDALWYQFQNNSAKVYNEGNRIESETDDDEQNDKQQHIMQEERISGPKTGPKGVKADHDYYQQKQLAAKTKAYAEYNARILAKAPTTTTYQEDIKEELLILGREEEEEDDDDDLKDYREKRLQELKQIKENNHSIRQQQKVFGSLITVNMNDYVKHIDHEWKTISVIVHLYDEKIPQCTLLDSYLSELARKYVLAKFIRVSAIDLDFDLVGSPAILAYQGGILIANLVRIIDEIGTRFDVESIEDILLRHGALSENDLYEEQTQIKEDSDDDYDI
ncbi:thioredoxin-like protein [Cokeromyces recurvatus]|uniref:thioredoxin-like protein n=1 Tax=Cokeromyces recurvatus TaxID=90255 RepID=UPI0022210552|nr:thioredoxin-like protein [Cokeromyces recurvatus]KAI7901784.1 thioredoxin-like protein [Cokeromyces recurvatus]